jgi:hypothetical protein
MTSTPDTPVPPATGAESCVEACGLPESVVKSSKKGKREERREKGPIEKAILALAWLFLLGSVAIAYLWPVPEGQPDPSFLLRGARAGAKELLDFLSTHLVSAMIPAFFLAAAISTFFSKETIIKAMGRQANPLVAYPIAASPAPSSPSAPAGSCRSS